MGKKTYRINEYDDWNFIEENLPNYDSRDDVLYNDIVTRYVNGEEIDDDDMEMMQEAFSSIEEAEKWLAKDDKRLFLEAVDTVLVEDRLETITCSMPNICLKDKVKEAHSRINMAFEQARQDLEDILRDCGGFIKTLPSNDKPNILVKTYDTSDNVSTELVFGIRLIEGEGIFICTTTSAENYEYDKGYSFDYLYNFENGTEDMENIEKLVSDPAYYIDIDEDYIDTRELVYEILSALEDYLDC